MANGTFQMFRPEATPAPADALTTLSTPTARMAAAAPVQTTTAVAAGAPLLGPEDMIEVPMQDVPAMTRWYSNVLGPAKTPGRPVTRVKKSIWDRFQAARQRITALARRDGSKSVILNYSEPMWRKWRELDLDGLAAWDREVVSLGPIRRQSALGLSMAPKRYFDWFAGWVRTGREAGQSFPAAINLAAGRLMTAAEKRVIFGFDITPSATLTLAPGFLRAVKPAAAAPALISPGILPRLPTPTPAAPAPLPMLPPGFAPPDVEPEPRLPFVPPEVPEEPERDYGDMIQTGALYGGGGAAAGALGAHLLKKSKGWGALLGAGAGLALGLWIMPYMRHGPG